MNHAIRAFEVRVIDEEGTVLGVMSPREAMSIAEARGMDLIEIAPTAKPPTCRLMDYGKWKYENKKKQVAAKKKQVVISVKEIQLRPRTDEHDLNVKLKHARRFLLDGDKVKVNLRFSGREMAHQEIGLSILNRVGVALAEIGTIEAQPKLEGRQMFILVSPDPDKIRDYEKTKGPALVPAGAEKPAN